MKLKIILPKTALLLIATILCASNSTLAQTRKKSEEQKQETSNERFFHIKNVHNNYGLSQKVSFLR